MIHLRHLWLALTTLPGLLFASGQRRLFAEMRAFARRLPQLLLERPLLEVLASVTPVNAIAPLPSSISDGTPGGRVGGEGPSADRLRSLADTAALLDRRSPLGLCLRRSLVRYHFLRRAGVPVVLQFGARFAAGKPDRDVTGHAWLTLDGQPYFEAGENYRGFTVMLEYPRPN